MSHNICIQAVVVCFPLPENANYSSCTGNEKLIVMTIGNLEKNMDAIECTCGWETNVMNGVTSFYISMFSRDNIYIFQQLSNENRVVAKLMNL